MARAFVGVGSNIDPEKNIPAALTGLLPEGLSRVSTVYRTVPVGSPGAPMFCNCVAELVTRRPPMELKRSVLKPLEISLGRRPGDERCAPRPIDLDLIVYGSLQVDQEGLTLPDPDILTRAFLAYPLLELAPDLAIPGKGPLGELAQGLDRCGMEEMAAFTARLRKQLFGR